MKTRRTPKAREFGSAYLPDAFVIDCSVCLPWYVSDEASAFCDQIGLALHRSEVWVPALWRAELVSAVMNAERRKRMTAERRLAVLANANLLPVRIDFEVPGIAALGELAVRHGLAPHDSIYFELASRRRLSLATLDAAVVKAGRAAGLSIITDTSAFPEP